MSLKIHTKIPNTRDFRYKNSQSKRFYAEYTENLGYSMKFFQKIRKIAVISVILIKKSDNLGRKLRKIGFFAKTNMNFRKDYFYK